MADPNDGETRNTISGGIQRGPVLQGRDFRDVHVGDIVQAAAAPVALAQLPALVEGFTGRDAELAQITALLDRGGNTGTVVVSAVAGMAGVGKTALAIQAAHDARQAGWFPGGVLFIDLHGYDDAPVKPGQALDALLRALGIAAEHIPPGAEERAGLYRSALAQFSDPVLIIADNASSEAQVRPLVPGPGPHRLVVTSRHTLAGLDARLLDVAVLDDEAGAALLDRALRAARPGDVRIPANRPAAARLAGICGGLPLALQITAALLKVDPSLTVDDMAGELADEVERLETLQYDDGSGTSGLSVAAAFELSYRRLNEADARVFRLLAVNPGPDVSAEVVTILAYPPISNARKVVRSLVKAHLVEAAAGAGDRWRMHDLLRLYVRQLSDAHAVADGREQVRDRLLGFYLYMANTADNHLRAAPDTTVFTSRDAALEWLDAERPNLVPAVSMAAETGRDEFALHLPTVLNEYFKLRRRLDDFLTTVTISRDAARRLGRPHHESMALDNLGAALVEMRRFDEAITAHQDAAAICQETGDRHGEGKALSNLGRALAEVRRFEEAITACRNAAAILREARDQRSESIALNNLGRALVQVRRFEEAITACRNAAAIAQELGDRRSETRALTNLGIALRAMQQVEEAITTLRAAAATAGETGDRHGEAMALTNLGIALREMQQVEEAITTLRAAAATFRETGDRHGEAMALMSLGIALEEMQQVEEAITTLRAAAATFRETGDQYSEGGALNNLGVALRKAGWVQEAITACQDAAAIFRETGNQPDEAMALTNLGIALEEMQQVEEAITAHRDAAAIARDTGDRYGEGRALNDLGIALRKAGWVQEAITTHQDAAAICRETDNQPGEAIALLNLELDRAAQQT